MAGGLPARISYREHRDDKRLALILLGAAGSLLAQVTWALAVHCFPSRRSVSLFATFLGYELFPLRHEIRNVAADALEAFDETGADDELRDFLARLLGLTVYVAVITVVAHRRTQGRSTTPTGPLDDLVARLVVGGLVSLLVVSSWMLISDPGIGKLTLGSVTMVLITATAPLLARRIVVGRHTREERTDSTS